MEKPSKTSPFQNTLGFPITLRCNLRCRHCVVSAEKKGSDMPLDTVRAWLEETTKLKHIETVCFTGGEPFLVYNVLKEGVNIAHDLGFKVTVVTNGYWAKSMPHALKLLKAINHLSRMTISFDRYHLEFLPLETLKTAIRAGQETGITTDIRISYLNNEEKEIDEAARLLDGVLSRDKITTQPIVRAGRAASLTDGDFCSFELDMPCEGAGIPVLQPDGNLQACCGPAYNLPYANPLWLGNVNETSLSHVLEEAQYNPAVHVIRSRGPYHLWKMVRGENQEDLKRFDTTNFCSFCMSMMSDSDFLRDLYAFTADPAVLKRVAVERFFVLQEPEMLVGLKTRNIRGNAFEQTCLQPVADVEPLERMP